MQLPRRTNERQEQQSRVNQLKMRIQEAIASDQSLTTAEILSALGKVSQGLVDDCLTQELEES